MWRPQPGPEYCGGIRKTPQHNSRCNLIKTFPKSGSASNLVWGCLGQTLNRKIGEILWPRCRITVCQCACVRARASVRGGGAAVSWLMATSQTPRRLFGPFSVKLFCIRRSCGQRPPLSRHIGGSGLMMPTSPAERRPSVTIYGVFITYGKQVWARSVDTSSTRPPPFKRIWFLLLETRFRDPRICLSVTYRLIYKYHSH